MIYDVLISKRKLYLYPTGLRTVFILQVSEADTVYLPWINFANMSYSRLNNSNATYFSSPLQR